MGMYRILIHRSPSKHGPTAPRRAGRDSVWPRLGQPPGAGHAAASRRDEIRWSVVSALITAYYDGGPRGTTPRAEVVESRG